MKLARQRDLARVIRSAGGRDGSRIAALLADHQVKPAALRRIGQFAYAAPRARLGAKININAIWMRRIRVALRLTLMVEPSDCDLFHG